MLRKRTECSTLRKRTECSTLRKKRRERWRSWKKMGGSWRKSSSSSK